MFDGLVDLTEPICQRIDAAKASMALFDPSGIIGRPFLLNIGTRWIDGVFYNVFAVFTLSYATQQLGVSWDLSGLCYLKQKIRYSGISFVYHAPSFLVAGIVPSLCTYFLKTSNGSVMVIGIFVVFVSIVSTACGYIMQKRHDNNMAQADMG